MKWTAVVENGVECAEWRVSNRVWKVKRKVEWKSCEWRGVWTLERREWMRWRIEVGKWELERFRHGFCISCHV